MDIGHGMPRHAHNSQFGGLLHCLALGWNHFVALVIFTFWWTFGSLGAILFPSKLFILSNVVCIHSTQVECIRTVKNSFHYCFLLSDSYNNLFRIKTQPRKFVSVLSIVGCFLYGSEEFPERLSDIGLGISLAHRPSHITQTISFRFKIKIPVHVQY